MQDCDGVTVGVAETEAVPERLPLWLMLCDFVAVCDRVPVIDVDCDCVPVDVSVCDCVSVEVSVPVALGDSVCELDDDWLLEGDSLRDCDCVPVWLDVMLVLLVSVDDGVSDCEGDEDPDDVSVGDWDAERLSVWDSDGVAESLGVSLCDWLVDCELVIDNDGVAVALAVCGVGVLEVVGDCDCVREIVPVAEAVSD